MRWPRTSAMILLALGWAALAAWQYRAYRQECAAARAALGRQADAIGAALVGGLCSHRRPGPFFEEQARGLLDGVARAGDVRAVAVTTPDGETLLAAGDTSALALAGATPGETLGAGGLQRVAAFEITPGPGGGPGAGRGGLGGGPGWGPGWGRLSRGDADGPFARGGPFFAVLVLDRGPFDDVCRRAARAGLAVGVAGGLVLLGLAGAWAATVRLSAARAALRVEARHLAELNQAAAGLAHETRNPLGLIRGWAQQIAGGDPAGGNPPAGRARAIVEECDRVTARINQFLAFARPAEPAPEPVGLAALLDDLAALVEPDLAARRLRLVRELPPGLARVCVDPDMLRRTLFNLLQNAAQWSPAGGTIAVRADRRGRDRVRVEVADRGPGVAEAARGSLFVPYYSTRPGGTGLGLAIVRRLAAAHGWEVSYEPRSGGGAVFRLDGLAAAPEDPSPGGGAS